MEDGETADGMETKPGGAPETTAAFSELESDSEMYSKLDMRLIETLQGQLTERFWIRRWPMGKP